MVVFTKSVHNTFWAVNTEPNNRDLNSFLHFFDIWGSYGRIQFEKGNPVTLFELNNDAAVIFKTDTLKRVGRKLNTVFVFE